MILKTYPMPNSAILRLNSERDNINTDPDYQRRSDIWTLDKRQLLIDSILNDYDMPKLYFHLLSIEQKKDSGTGCDYAIIDGKQRLETVWGFIDGNFRLADDFIYLLDPKVKAGGLTYVDIAKEYPKLKIRFDSFGLPIMLVETDDIDLIEDMFSRMNEAVPLNAAEKRNAFGGSMAEVIRRVSSHDFFTTRVRFNNNRYQHREVAAKLLYLEYSLKNHGKITDTKKPYLDAMVKQYTKKQEFSHNDFESMVINILNLMTNIFSKEDPLLKAQSPITVYYLLFKDAQEQNRLGLISRAKLISFQEEMERNQKQAAEDITKANFDYLEYDRMSQQGTNDAASIKERVRILKAYVGL